MTTVSHVEGNHSLRDYTYLKHPVCEDSTFFWLVSIVKILASVQTYYATEIIETFLVSHKDKWHPSYIKISLLIKVHIVYSLNTLS